MVLCSKLYLCGRGGVTEAPLWVIVRRKWRRGWWGARPQSLSFVSLLIPILHYSSKCYYSFPNCNQQPSSNSHSKLVLLLLQQLDQMPGTQCTLSQSALATTTLSNTYTCQIAIEDVTCKCLLWDIIKAGEIEPEENIQKRCVLTNWEGSLCHFFYTGIV